MVCICCSYGDEFVEISNLRIVKRKMLVVLIVSSVYIMNGIACWKRAPNIKMLTVRMDVDRMPLYHIYI